ncbi:hypothetical protein B0H19DRAFT_1068734 [Mycena capillaripes]|nr:hypothetical protein B0H19DRAFT_1068734 [Mycena capillaripes]
MDLEAAIMQLRPTQVLLVNSYNFNENSATHQQFTQFYIRARMDIADEYHNSPRFVHREWNENSGKRRPGWMKYVNHPAGITSYSVHSLESEVRNCSRYGDIWDNQPVAEELYAWALAMISSNPNIHCLWPPTTPPDREPEPRSTRKRAIRIQCLVY